MNVNRKRERDDDEEGPETASARHSGRTTGLMPSTDAVLEAQLDRLRTARGSTVPIPRWAYAQLEAQLRDKAAFLHALRGFHAQVGGAGAAVMVGVTGDELVKAHGLPPVSLYELFHAVAAAGGAAQLRGDPDWRRVAFVPGVLAASRAALADVSGLPSYVRKTWQVLLSGMEVVHAGRIARDGARQKQQQEQQEQQQGSTAVHVDEGGGASGGAVAGVDDEL